MRLRRKFPVIMSAVSSGERRSKTSSASDGQDLEDSVCPVCCDSHCVLSLVCARLRSAGTVVACRPTVASPRVGRCMTCVLSTTTDVQLDLRRRIFHTAVCYCINHRPSLFAMQLELAFCFACMCTVV